MKHENQSVGLHILNSLVSGTTLLGGRFQDNNTNNQPGIDAFGALFAFYDGQGDVMEHMRDEGYYCGGMFGGYVAYNDAVSMRMTNSDLFPDRTLGFPNPLSKCIAFNTYNEMLF